MRLLVIEDNRQLVANLFDYFESRGHVLDVAPDGITGLHLATTQTYDVVILDWMLPRMEGPEVLRRLRSDHASEVPVIMLTARDDLPDKIAGFRAGADDYLTKPFSFAILLARVRALLRRGAGERPTIIEAGDLTLDPATKRVARGDTVIELTAREHAVLEYLMRRKGEVVTKREVVEGVWDFDFDGDPNIVEVYVGHLRNKVDRPFGRAAIETLRGSGYRLAAHGG